MRRLLFVSLLFAAACSSSGQSVHVPNVGVIVPEAGAESTLGRCGDLLGMQSKWARALRLEGWRIQMVCADIDEKEQAWALSYVEPATMEMGSVVDPDAPDVELAVLHELTHAALTYVREADSELVEENAVRVLSEQMICRPFKSDK